jgi:predicted transposase/invertase (TIGR01784 family)
MTDKPKLTLSNPKNKLNIESKLSKNTERVSLTEILSQDKSNRSNSGSTNSPNKNLKINTVKTGQPSFHTEILLTHEEYLAIVEYLQKNYPKCFPARNTPPLPLALGIHKQLLASEGLPFAKVKIRRFLKRYTRSKEYRRNLIIGSPRVDLQGNQTGTVTEEEVNYAKWKEVKKEKIKSANHDSLIKKALENPLIAEEFLSEYLPDEYKELIDLSTIKPEKETYVEESLKTKLSDMVFSVQMRDQEGDKVNNAFIYALVEHQSYSDYWIAFRLLKYSLLLLERHTSRKNKLPIILPLVIYNGKAKYKAPKNIFDLFAYPDIARKVIAEDYNLIDLQAMDDDSIDYGKHLSFLLYTMRHIHERDTLSMIKEAMSRCSRAIVIDKEQNYILTRLILWYTDSKVPEEKKQLLEQLIVDNLPKQEANNIMRTIADSYIEEGFNKGIMQGIEKGKAEGKAELIKMMLNQGNSIDTIAKITGLSFADIKALI